DSSLSISPMQTSSLDPIRLPAPLAALRRCFGGGVAFAGLTCVVGALSLATAAHAMVTAVQGGPAVAGSILVGSLGETWDAFTSWVAASYARAPALVLGLAALVAVPPLALAGYLLRNRDAEES